MQYLLGLKAHTSLLGSTVLGPGFRAHLSGLSYGAVLGPFLVALHDPNKKYRRIIFVVDETE